MPFQLSPGVNVSEIDLTTVIPAVATTDAAIGGLFKWGPAGKATLVISQDELKTEYGRPTNDNYETWFTASNFLSYASRLWVSRAKHDTSYNDNVLFNVPKTNNYLFIEGTNAQISIGDEVVSSTEVSYGTTITDIDTGDISVAVTVGDIDTGNGYFDVTGSGSELLTGERVKLEITSGTTPPTGLSDNSYYYAIVLGVNRIALASSFAGAMAGSELTYASAGDANFTLTRTGDTRLTLSADTITAAGAAASYQEVFSLENSLNAIANTNSLGSNGLLLDHVVNNEDEYEAASIDFDQAVHYVAKYPGALGDSLAVSVCDSEAAYNSSHTISAVDAADANVTIVTTMSLTVGEKEATLTTDNTNQDNITDITDTFEVGDLLRFGNSTIGYQYLEVESIGAPVTANGVTTSSITFADTLALSEDVNLGVGENVNRYWKYYDLVTLKPGQSQFVREQGNTAANDEMHVVVIDEDGKFSGTPGTILEVYTGLSRATNARGIDGDSIYYKEVINQSSKYIYAGQDRIGAPTATAANITSATTTNALQLSFVYGRDIEGNESSCIIGDILRAYDVFKSAEDYDISLVLTGKSRGGANGTQLANYLIDNLGERRKDCVVFCSPEKADVVETFDDISENVVTFRNSLRSSSYGSMDSGYKYQYDKFNDVYRWVPMNGDVAGLCAQTDDTRDPWWSPAGFNRGNIRNIVKLAWNPRKAERDVIYSSGINPVVNFPGQGIVLFGDKTLLAKPSAFDRLNVRRLFIVLEKAIAAASQYTLFEFNDAFTRASFVNLVNPYLRDVQARRGITDFIVICDETNNTGEVIDRNEFVGDIYIKPARSINFIQLNFVAVRTGVEFSEVIGQF